MRFGARNKKTKIDQISTVGLNSGAANLSRSALSSGRFPEFIGGDGFRVPRLLIDWSITRLREQIRAE
jgi:hypothetical protein